MKKTAIIIILLGCSLLVGCSSGVSKEKYESVAAERDEYKAIISSDENDPESSENSNTEEKSEEKSDKKPKLEESDYLKQLEIKEYFYTNSINDTYYCMVVKNNSDTTLKLNANVTAKDDSGNLIGAKTIEHEAVENGYSVCMTTIFDGKNVSSFEYSITAKPDEYYEPVLSDISFEVTATDKKAIVSCTNNGNEPAEFVEIVALFFKEGNIVYSGSTYCIDDDSQLKPENTIIKEINGYADFDTVEVYLSGRK